MHHAGVAVKVIFYLEKDLLIPLYSVEMFVAECKMINLESIEELSIEMRCLVRQVVHHAGVAAKVAIKMMKQRDSVMQKNRDVDEKRV